MTDWVWDEQHRNYRRLVNGQWVFHGDSVPTGPTQHPIQPQIYQQVVQPQAYHQPAQPGQIFQQTTPYAIAYTLTHTPRAVPSSSSHPQPSHTSTAPYIHQKKEDGEIVEALDANYQIYRPSYFQVGQVFRILWVEPSSNRTGKSATGLCRNPRYPDEWVFTKTKWFVVLRDFELSCCCLPIQTFGNRGVGKDKLVKGHHGIACTDYEPAPLDKEKPEPGEAPMRRAIKVLPYNGTGALLALSRVAYHKVINVEKNIRIWPFGYLDDDSITILQSNFESVFNYSASNLQSPPSQSYVVTASSPPIAQSSSAAQSESHSGHASEPRSMPILSGELTGLTSSDEQNTRTPGPSQSGNFGNNYPGQNYTPDQSQSGLSAPTYPSSNNQGSSYESSSGYYGGPHRH